MPRRHDDDEDSFDDFDPTNYGWSPEDWEELKEIYDVDTDDELIELFPELVNYQDFMSELDYLDELNNLVDDEDFYVS